MKPKVYIETSVISYLTAKLSRDLITAGHQKITQEWWKHRRQEFTLHISQLVVKEASARNTTAASKRLSVLPDIPILLPNDEVTHLTNELLFQQALPTKAADDVVHVALATVHQMDYLLTWNCRHLANAELQRTVARICQQQGYQMPIICTPETLMGK